ncbi:3-methylornithine--L-lysine ligase PylC [Dehalobacter sp. DCM]|uniref:3-methylornithine--L-lysine ligase PylC n=1 Tax=Dehalobacter sp. DCM TaxID=2907827 RepID=UPI003082100B|nr:3-methylornithine--L-lysine ligase PylC [Dehalobacter sp. DCM]
MINILIIGAKLQGVEAIYLAKKAGYYVTVIDHNAEAPGRDLADEFINADIFDEEAVLSVLSKAEVVLPVIEDADVLAKVQAYGQRLGLKVLFDLKAYTISRSKTNSNDLFFKNNLPVPKIYPDCTFPVILKPDGESGSRNVIKAYSQSEIEAYLEGHIGEQTVVQEYLEGASYSLEVIGDGEHFYFPQITEVVVADDYDCKRIIAPAAIGETEKQQMLAIGQSLAESLKIKGIFDIEVISHKGKLKLLEIDARLPSQTPVSVYHSTGMNMVHMMTELALGNSESVRILPAKQVCIYQQIHVSGGKITVAGEHMIASCRHLKIREGLFGCKEAITDYEEGSHNWKGIIIVVGESQEKAYAAFDRFIGQMKKELEIENWELVD